MVNICFCLFILANNKPTRRNSCPGEGDGLVFKNRYAVRCCSMDGAQCITPTGCWKTQFLKVAWEECSDLGMRLCTPNEMGQGICCQTGCGLNFENSLNWQSQYNQVSFSASFESRITLRRQSLSLYGCNTFDCFCKMCSELSKEIFYSAVT